VIARAERGLGLLLTGRGSDAAVAGPCAPMTTGHDAARQTNRRLQPASPFATIVFSPGILQCARSFRCECRSLRSLHRLPARAGCLAAAVIAALADAMG